MEVIASSLGRPAVHGSLRIHQLRIRKLDRHPTIRIIDNWNSFSNFVEQGATVNDLSETDNVVHPVRNPEIRAVIVYQLT